MLKRPPRRDAEEMSYWLSYSDMMAALLLTFVLIISFTMLQAKQRYENMEKELAFQQQTVKEQQVVMQAQQEHLDKLIGVRSGLIETLKKEFDGTNLSVKVDPQTGAITFDSSVLFDYNKYNLKPGGQEFLTQFLPRYINILMGGEFKEYISEIIIEGHTDTNGDYLFNLELSQKRAMAVASYCLTENNILPGDMVNELRSIVTANGRSFSNPVYQTDGAVDMQASRRVEFKFRLKDEEMIADMIEILSNE